MPKITRDQIENDFQTYLDKILNNKDLISLAVKERGTLLQGENVPVDVSKPISLTMGELYFLFNEDGNVRLKDELYERHKIRFNEDLINANPIIKNRSFQNLPFRDKLIIDAAVTYAAKKIAEKYKGLIEAERNELTSNQQITQDVKRRDLLRLKKLEEDLDLAKMPKRIVGSWVLTNGIMNPATSYSLNPQLRQKLKQDAFHFTKTDVFISGGPSTDKTTFVDLKPFLTNLKNNKINHIFAIGRTFPYFRQRPGRKELTEEIAIQDFFNYFIPDANGVVELPPGFEEFKIRSKAIEKVGRFTKYQVTINDNPPINVYHLPVRDVQPLNLDDNELAYIKHIQDKNPNENIHTHCAGGRGRSAQIAYILNARNVHYANERDPKKRLNLMREEKGHKVPDENDRFVQNVEQEKHLEELELKLNQTPPHTPCDSKFFNLYELFNLLFLEELRKRKNTFLSGINEATRMHGIDLRTLDAKKKEEIKFFELYHQFLECDNVEKLNSIVDEVSKLSICSQWFKKIISGAGNCTRLYDLVVKNHPNIFEAEKFVLSDTASIKDMDEKLNMIDANLCIQIQLRQAYARQFPLMNKDQQQAIMQSIALKIPLWLDRIHSDLSSIKTQTPFETAGYLNKKWEGKLKIFTELKELYLLYDKNRNLDEESGKTYTDLNLSDKFAELVQILKMGPNGTFGFSDDQLNHLSSRVPGDVREASSNDTLLRDTDNRSHQQSIEKNQRKTLVREKILNYAIQNELTAKYSEIVVEPKDEHPRPISLPTQPKMLIFDVDDTLVDLRNNRIKHKELLIPLLRYALNHNIQIAISTARSHYGDRELKLDGKYSVNKLLKEIERELEQELGRSIKINRVFYLNDDHLKESRVYLRTHIGALERQLETADPDDKPSIENKIKRLDKLVRGKNLTLEELRTRYKVERGEDIKESDCIFVDDNKDLIKNANDYTNYRCVKATDAMDESKLYLTELAYQMGVYNSLIKFLNSDKEDTFDFISIPNFTFRDDPLFRHVDLQRFYNRVSKLNMSEAEQERAKLDFTLSVVINYDNLSPELQDKVVIPAYRFICQSIDAIHSKLLNLKRHPQGNESEQLRSLSQTVSDLLVLEETYSKKFGPSYLDVSLHRLQSIISNFDRVSVFREEFNIGRDIENEIKQSSLITAPYRTNQPHANLTDLDEFKTQKKKYRKQLANTVEPLFDNIIDQCNDIFKLPEPQKCYTFKSVIEKLESYDFRNPNLAQVLPLLDQIKRMVATKDKLSEVAQEKPTDPVELYQARVAAIENKIKDSDQYKAMVFLQNAKKYLTEREWDVGWQWTKYTIDGTERRIPRNVAKQLDEIKLAEQDGNYIQHKDNFFYIADNKKWFLFSSAKSKEYFTLFKSQGLDENRNPELRDKRIDKTFKPT